MSDDRSRDERLISPSTDSGVSRRADALETFLAALENDAASDASPQRDRSSIVTSVADTEFAHRLVMLGADIAPDADFASRLQVLIEHNIRDHSQVGDAPRSQSADSGSAGIAGDATNPRRQRIARSLSLLRRLRPL